MVADEVRSLATRARATSDEINGALENLRSRATSALDSVKVADRSVMSAQNETVHTRELVDAVAAGAARALESTRAIADQLVTQATALRSARDDAERTREAAVIGTDIANRVDAEAARVREQTDALQALAASFRL
ncbi:MAG: hypothetical protein MUF30_13510 [Burkholderiales bacterium]|nr:hypothetical protein [Burkholderiales bacterium]